MTSLSWLLAAAPRRVRLSLLLSPQQLLGACGLGYVCRLKLRRQFPLPTHSILSAVAPGSVRVGLEVVRRRRARLGEGCDVLGVAVGHPEDVRADRHEPATRLLSAGAAGGANVEHDLVARAAFVARAAEHRARHLEQRRVVVERPAGAAAELVQGVAEERERLRGDFEAQHMALHGRVRQRARCSAGLPL